jgi:6-phosphogluconolactonase
VIRTATSAIAQRGRFTIALSGGSTPKNMYTLIAANASASLPWDQMFFFWSDERHVGPDDPDSNYRMANETLLSKVPVPTANIFRVPSENPDAGAAADAYEQTVRKFFGVEAGEFPRFDLILLGMGPDGHTASLFPETAALQETSRPDYIHTAHAELGPLCRVPCKRNGQSGGSARSSGERCLGRKISF